jgi:uncharacterized protein
MRIFPFQSRRGHHVLIVPHSRIFDVVAADGDDVGDGGDAAPGLPELDAALFDAAVGEEPLSTIPEPAPQSISLNVSNRCNLGCGYCYAAQGGFQGAQPSPMDQDTARRAIDRLVAVADASRPITIGFLGGEPFANRALIHWIVGYGDDLARRSALDVRYSVTTNGTLLNPADLELLRSRGFAVTVSIDGGAEVHDAQRPRPLGKRVGGSWAQVVEHVRPLLENPGRARICARATVTNRNLDVAAHLRSLVEVGFTEVGFAPLRTGPSQAGALRDVDWPVYLDALIAASRPEVARLHAGEPSRLSNLAIALKQLHRGASSPYPCGAGGGYFSVSAEGRWYACHRAIGDPAFELGTSTGLDVERRRAFLTARHVDAQVDCRSCWARYLCSGGCHQEASARTPPSCDFIRGWLEFCLSTYCELGAVTPDIRTGVEEGVP